MSVVEARVAELEARLMNAEAALMFLGMALELTLVHPGLVREEAIRDGMFEHLGHDVSMSAMARSEKVVMHATQERMQESG